MGYHFGPLFGTRDFSFGGTQLFEGSSFGFRFGVRFGTHFVTENSLKRRPKRQEKEEKATETKMWFLYIAGAIREAFEVVWKNEKPEKN